MKYLKTFESKIEMKNYLKEYAQYLLDIYKKVNTQYYDNSRVGLKLIEFIETGTMRHLIYKNTKMETKISILSDDIQYHILRLMEERNLNIDNVFEYDEFVNFKKSGLTIDEYVNSKRYNL